MSSIDDRIVAMKFDNSRFERGVATTLSTLDKLKRALSFGKTSDPLADVQKSANGMNLNPAMRSVEGLSAKFIALSTVAITALSNIVNKATDAGLNLAKSLTLEPVMEGFQEYELKMGSIQTILSNTSRHGTTLGDVTKNLDELNHYADKTIYNFGDMTKNIGLFTNAGIKIEDATAMIKGFSNEAAASGTNSQGAASAAYQLSQALSAGTIRLMDWRSLQNVGMGNKNMQNGLIEIAEAMGEFEKAGTTANATQKDFNGSLEKKWLSAQVMENYLKIQAGELGREQMKSIGLTDKQIDGFLKQQKISEEAATKVRTWTQLIGTLKEGVGSSWAETFDIILGDFNEATELFTNVSETLGDMFGKAGKQRNEMFKEWDKLGGRTAAIEAIANAWKGLMGILKPIKEAWRDIFPAKTGKDLYNLTITIRNLTRNFKMGAETSENLKRTFRGFFAVLSIGWQIIKGVAGVIGDLFGIILGGSGGFLEFTGSIGDFFTNIDKNMKKGKGLSGFFSGLSSVLGGGLKGLMAMTGAIGDFFDSLNLGTNIQKAFGAFLKWIGEAFGNIGEVLKDAMGSKSFDPVLDLIKTGLLGGILLLIKKFLKDGLVNINVGEGLVDSIKDTFEGLTDSLKAMQASLNAKTLLTIAGAIALLAGSVLVLSKIDSKALTKALTAMAIGFGQLLGAMAILVKISGAAGFLKIPFIAAGLILLATSIVILSAAVKILSKLSWTELQKGLTGVGVLLGVISGAAWALSKSSKGLFAAGVSILFISVAIAVLAKAVKAMGGMKWNEIGKGLLTMAASLAIVIASMYAVPPNMFATAASMLILSVAIATIAKAVAAFGSLKTEEISQGLIGLAASLAIIAVAMYAMPPNMVLTATSLLILSVALNAIATSVETFGDMNWDELARGLVGLAASLTILGIAMMAMNGAVVGAFSLMLAAAALAMLVPPVIALSMLSWSELAVGMTALALSLTILGIAAYAIGPMSLVIVALGAGMLLLGAGLAMAGAGALAFSTAFATVVGLGVAGINLLTQFAKSLIELFPSIALNLAKAIVSFMVELAKNAPAMITALSNIMISLLNAVIRTIPKMRETATKLIQAILQVISENVDDMARVGMQVLMAFLNAIKNNIYQITTIGSDIMIRFMTAIEKKVPSLVRKGTNLLISFINAMSKEVYRAANAAGDLVVAFLTALGLQVPKISQAGAKLIITTINGIATAINNNQAELNKAGNRLAMAIINGITWGLKFNAGKVGQAATNVAKQALDGAKQWLGIKSPSRVFRDEVGKQVSAGFAEGIEAEGRLVERSSLGVAEAAVNSAQTVLSRLSDAVQMETSDPVVKPVLDLSNIHGAASQISGMMGSPSLPVTSAYSDTNAIAEQLRTNQAVEVERASVAPVQNVKFEQHNHSPESLSEIEIYRQTQNIMSEAKGALI